jgi:molecular chaperone GrpE
MVKTQMSADPPEVGKSKADERGSNKNLAPRSLKGEVGWEEKYKRARADYINLERRVKEQQSEFLKFANAVLVTKLLPVLDDLEKATATAEDDGLPALPSRQAGGRQGLNLVLKNFGEVIKSEGVEEIKVKEGDKFDPNIMECTVAEDSGEDAKVSEILRKGYKMKEKVLRPAQVRVGNSKS